MKTDAMVTAAAAEALDGKRVLCVCTSDASAQDVHRRVSAAMEHTIDRGIPAVDGGQVKCEGIRMGAEPTCTVEIFDDEPFYPPNPRGMFGGDHGPP